MANVMVVCNTIARCSAPCDHGRPHVKQDNCAGDYCHTLGKRTDCIPLTREQVLELCKKGFIF